jgi:hypothetical protein
MNAQTRQHLDDLRRAGFDISGLEQQINSSPVLDRQADNLIGGGILRQQAFTRITQEKANEVKTLQDQITQLTALKAAGAGENDAAYKAALAVIAEQENLLLAYYDEEEIKALSARAVQNAVDKIIPQPQQHQPPANIPSAKVEDDMGNIDTSKFLDTDTYRKETEAQVFGNVALTAMINNAMLEAQKLGVQIPQEKITSLGVDMRNALAQGRQVPEFIDEHFGLAAKRIEAAETARTKELEDARNQGYAEGAKSGGVPRRAATKVHHPLDGVVSNRRPQEKIETPTEVPKNKFGDAEIYRMRGDRNSRIESAVAYMDKVIDRTERENSIPSE